MTKQLERGSIVHIVIIGVVVLVIAGLLVWRFIDTQASKSSKGTVSTQQAERVSNTTETDQKTYVSVKDWGVKFALSNHVKQLSLSHDTSKSLFPGDVILISSVTDSSEKSYAKFDGSSTATAGPVDAICSTYGIGRTKNSSETNLESGVAYEQVAHVGEYYYYSIAGVGGASCEQSDAVLAAINAAMEVLKKPLAE